MDIADLAVGLGIVASKTLYFGLREKKKKAWYWRGLVLHGLFLNLETPGM